MGQLFDKNYGDVYMTNVAFHFLMSTAAKTPTNVETFVEFG
jgi:hypothetical protein